MEIMGSGEAKTHLPRLLERVAQGEAFTITKQGVPIARLVPIEEQPKPEIQQVIEEIVAFRKQQPVRGVPLNE